MSTSHERPPKTVVIRARSATVIFVLAALIIVGLSVDAFVRGDPIQSLLAMPWMAIILWFIYVVLYRPSVTVGPEGLTVKNILRHHRVPWGAVAEVNSRFQLTLRLHDGRKIVSWGAPTTAIERARVRSAGDGFRAADMLDWVGVRSFLKRPTPSDSTRSLITELREEWGADAPRAEADSVWEWWALGTSAILVVLCVASVLAVRG